MIFWKRSFGKVTPISHSHNAFHLVIFANNPKNWVLFVIYNSQNLNVQKVLWNHLSAISLLDLPWLLVGDFNAILNSNERRGGNFNHFISHNQFLDLGVFGPAFT